MKKYLPKKQKLQSRCQMLQNCLEWCLICQFRSKYIQWKKEVRSLESSFLQIKIQFFSYSIVESHTFPCLLNQFKGNTVRQKTKKAIRFGFFDGAFDIVWIIDFFLWPNEEQDASWAARYFPPQTVQNYINLRLKNSQCIIRTQKISKKMKLWFILAHFNLKHLI